MMENKKVAAREMFVKITQSAMFTSGEGSEQIQLTLKYNVHKNLYECYTEKEIWAEADSDLQNRRHSRRDDRHCRELRE